MEKSVLYAKITVSLNFFLQNSVLNIIYNKIQQDTKLYLNSVW